MPQINFEEIENIKVDCIVGFGVACRTADALKRNNLRYFSNPFDWQMAYSLEQVITLLKNKGKTFYKNCYEDKNFSTYHTTGIVDESGMISMHDFPKGGAIEKAPHFFQKKYKHRFKELNNQLKKAKSILILTYRNIDIQTMEEFIDEFSKLYKHKQLYYINIYDTKDQKPESVDTIKKGNVTLIQYCFNDEHKKGRDKNTNPNFWQGRTEYWDEILKKISLNQNFVKKIKIKKWLYNISYDITNIENIHKIITVFGIKIKIKDKL